VLQFQTERTHKSSKQELQGILEGIIKKLTYSSAGALHVAGVNRAPGVALQGQEAGTRLVHTNLKKATFSSLIRVP
jgi:hypothetical protein